MTQCQLELLGLWGRESSRFHGGVGFEGMPGYVGAPGAEGTVWVSPERADYLLGMQALGLSPLARVALSLARAGSAPR